MRLSSLLIVFSTFATAALLSLVAASFSADLVEESSETSIKHEFTVQGLDWAEVYAEGLEVFLAGVAPSEAARFQAISAAGRIVDASRVIDNMLIEATADIAPPRFSVEILRNDAGISLIGLIPEGSDRDAIVANLRKLAGDDNVTDLLEAAAYDAPEGWADATRYALAALRQLPRSKISIEAGEVTITAMTDSAESRMDLESDLLRRAPKDVVVNLDISAPRPVISPFTLRFVIDEESARFDACSADSEAARTRILSAARNAGLSGMSACKIGLGVPTPTWAQAVERAIAGLADLGGGTVTFSDADITLTAALGTEQAVFDRVVGELEGTLPDIFALHSELPVAVTDDHVTQAPEFTATLSPEGLVQLRGRLANEISRETTHSYAKARFGSDQSYMAARLDENLPASWPFRVMAGMDALSLLHNGTLKVTLESVMISGRTGNPDANATIALILAEKLSPTDQFSIDVTYLEELDPLAALPTPEECVANIRGVLKDQKIAFEPGSGDLDESAAKTIDEIAAHLNECPDLTLEIQGHTDSQGRESMNLALSQTRAQSVLNALQDRRILTSGFTAQGYGESMPIADNGTAEGREANRRIEFVLVKPEAEAEEEERSEGAAPDGEEASAQDATGAEDTAAEAVETDEANSEDVAVEADEATAEQTAAEAGEASEAAPDTETPASEEAAAEAEATSPEEPAQDTQPETPTEDAPAEDTPAEDGGENTTNDTN